MRIPIASQRGQGRSIPLTAEKLVNLYAEQAPGGAKSQMVVHGTPGLTRFATIDTRPPRGMHRTPADGRLYVVIRNTLYYVSPEGVATGVGSIAGAGRVSMSDNGRQLCIVAGDVGYTYSQSEGLRQITSPAFPGALTVTYMDGYFIFNNPDKDQRGQFFISGIRDGQIYDAADFATAESHPDNLLRVFADHSELLLFGSETIEVWFNAGHADFPFARAQGSVIEKGLGATWSIAKVDNSVVWLDNEGIVRRLEGSTPLRISTHAIEYEIQRGDWGRASAWSYVQEGHEFYVLTVPAAGTHQTAGTYVFDAATGLWHERKTYRRDYWRAGFYANAYGKHIVADLDRGQLYEMSLDVYEEDGEHMIAEMQFPQIQNDGNRFVVDRLQLDMEVGSFDVPQSGEVRLTSERYPVFANDGPHARAGISSGEVRAMVQYGSAKTEGGAVSAGVAFGNIGPLLVLAGAETELLSVSAGVVGGTMSPLIVIAEANPEASAVSAGFASGGIVPARISYESGMESASVSAGFVGGVVEEI